VPSSNTATKARPVGTSGHQSEAAAEPEGQEQRQAQARRDQTEARALAGVVLRPPIPFGVVEVTKAVGRLGPKRAQVQKIGADVDGEINQERCDEEDPPRHRLALRL